MTTRRSDSHAEDFNRLETHLAGTLKRVAPPNGIVQRLRERITLPTRATITLRLHDWKTLFFVFGGVMSGMLLLVTIARALYYFVGRRHTL
ncbi:MAG: hypothetical protein IT311_13310 [Anaerolineales bacterium]|nr:hypothetical protein [Anaerolineales bacterium]MCZ2122092.1 hypothetical protein [Anaerolineales bacterium]